MCKCPDQLSQVYLNTCQMGQFIGHVWLFKPYSRWYGWTTASDDLIVRCFRITWKKKSGARYELRASLHCDHFVGSTRSFSSRTDPFLISLHLFAFEGRLRRHRSLQWTCAVFVFLGRQFFKSVSSESLDKKFDPQEGPRFRILWHP